MSSAKSVFLIGVSGGSASGKTEIARAAARAASPLEAIVLAEDDYYGDHGAQSDFEASAFNFDHPASRDHRLLVEHLSVLKAGQSVDAPIYDFTIHRRRADTRKLAPADVIIVEGIHLFCDEALRDLFDLKVYVKAPDDIRLARRILRDVRERGRTADMVVNQYLRMVRPMHHEWTSPSQKTADILITNDKAAARPVDHLTAFFDGLAQPVAEAIYRFGETRMAGE